MCPAESALEFRRRRAVELIQQGESKKIISRILGVSKNSLNVWLRKTEAGENLNTKASEGRPRRLNSQQLAELEELLKRGATAHGWDNNLWTTRRVREVIKNHFAIEFCRSHVWHILHDHLHWSAIRPAQQAAKRDDEEIARWKVEDFPRIERQAKQRNAHLAFVDENPFKAINDQHPFLTAPEVQPWFLRRTQRQKASKTKRPADVTMPSTTIARDVAGKAVLPSSVKLM
jgi:transposase